MGSRRIVGFAMSLHHDPHCAYAALTMALAVRGGADAVAPNLAIGNTILLKHAPQCPESAAAMQQIYDDAGFPAGAYVNIYAPTSRPQRSSPTHGWRASR